MPLQYPTTTLHNIAYLFQIIEDRHLLLAAIQHPVVSAEQPGAMLRGIGRASKQTTHLPTHYSQTSRGQIGCV